MNNLLQDLRYGARMLAKNPGFACVAILTLALGIGANTAIFSVVNAVLIRPLPYPDPDRIVMLWEKDKDDTESNTSFATINDWRAANQSFEDVAAIRSWFPTFSGEGEPERIPGLRVSSGFFSVIGVKPFLGRDFLSEEDTPATRRVVLLSYGLWQRRFSGNPEVVGKPIQLSGLEFTVVGVLPKDFESLVTERTTRRADMFAPLGYSAEDSSACRSCRHLRAIARLKPGVTLEQASAEMNVISQNLLDDHPSDYPVAGVVVRPLQEQLVGQFRTALYVLLAAVGFVLAVVATNLANLLLARSAQRQKEMSIRAALGAGRGRLMRQLLTEGMILSFIGGGLGVIVSMWGTELLLAMSPANIPRLKEAGIDIRVFAFILLVILLTGILFSLAPAIQASKFDLTTALKETGRGSTTASNRLRSALVIAEVALALVLLVGAGLVLKSFVSILRINPGFDPENALRMQIVVSGNRYDEDASIVNFYRETLARVKALPGVESAATVSQVPLGGNFDRSGLHIEDRPVANPADAPEAERYAISSDYLDVMRIPLLRGRTFDDQDKSDAALVVMINEAAARAFWSDSNPIGRRVKVGGPSSPWRTIVGIVGDVRHNSIDEKLAFQVYIPHSQFINSIMDLVVRTSVDPTSLTTAIREEIWSVDKDQPISSIGTLEQLVSTSVAERRFSLVLLGIFAASALLLAAIGLYGVISYVVTLRTQEIGIRIALGALPRDILKLIMRQGAMLIVLGIGTGIAASFVLTRFLSSMLYEVSTNDPVIFITIPAVLILVALAACYVPARRATKVDPMAALRCD